MGVGVVEEWALAVLIRRKAREDCVFDFGVAGECAAELREDLKDLEDFVFGDGAEFLVL